MIKLRAFGDPTLSGDGGMRLDGLTRQTKRFALLIYLACDDRPYPLRRDELVATFWPESDASHGRNALRQSIHVIRKEIGPDVLKANGTEELWVSQNRLQSDVGSFTRAISAGNPSLALSLYGADFLNGFHVPETPEFGLWAERRSTQLKDAAIRGAQYLAHQAEGERDLSEALFWWHRASDLSPYNEVFIRRIVSLLAGSGNVAEAAAEFALFRNRLESELGLAPSAGTLDLMRKASEGLIEEARMWTGDRRGEVPPATSSGWKRPTDQELL